MPVILLAVFIDLVGFGIIVPILPFLTLKYGGDAFTGAALVSIYSLMAFLSGPLWGRFSDYFGRRPALAATFLGATISYTALAFSDSLAFVFLARAMSGAMAGNIGIVMASIADMTTPENRGKAMGKVSAVFGLGFAFGPGIGGLLGGSGEEASIFLPGIVAAGLSFTALLLTARFVPETNENRLKDTNNNDVDQVEESIPSPKVQSPPKWSLILREKGQKALFCMFILTAIGQSITFAITPFWAEAMLGWNAQQVGYLLMGIGLSVAAIQSTVVGPLFKAIGEIRALALGVTVNIVGCSVIIMTPASPVTAFIGFPLIMCGLTFAFPALNSIVSQRTDKRLQGSALGFSNGLSASGRVVGPLSAGILFSTQGAATPFVVVSLVSSMTLLWSLYELRRVAKGELVEPTVHPQAVNHDSGIS